MSIRTLALASVALVLPLASCDAGNEGRPAASPGPRLTIASPRMDETLASDRVELMLDLRNYPIGKDASGMGPHVHVILDDEPYEAIYDVSKGIPLGKAGEDGTKRLSEGTHVVRVFPSAGPPKKDGDAEHHESRKNEGAFAWVRFHVKRPGGPAAAFDATLPTLTYSRPKGEYGTADPRAKERLLLDFYVTGTRLSAEGHGVRVTVDGKEAKLTDKDGKAVEGRLTEWKPYLLSPTPPPGEHTVAIELVDKDGKPVTHATRDGAPYPIAYPRTERKITIK